MCFHAQQAAEKAVKALLIWREIQFPYTHDLSTLLTLVEKAGGELPNSIREAERLTRFAVQTRYPGTGAPVSQEKYREAIKQAGAVLRWAEKQLKGTRR